MKKLLIGMAILAVMSTPRVSMGVLGLGDIVLDPTNLVQNSLQAVRSLISNANEVTQISNQAQSLMNEAKMLAQLPMSLMDEINAAIQTYNDLLNQGRGMAYILKNSIDQFEQLYNSNEPFMQRAGRLIGQIREAGRLSTMATSVYERLCAQQTRVGKLVAASQGSIGELQAMQAGNQLIGVLTEQQISIQQILATDQRLKISESMRMLVIEEQAYQNMQMYSQGMAVMPIRGPGEGQGFTLPE